MTTLAKSKAQALVQPAKPLAVTPNVRLFNSPAAGATLSLSNESTNIVQVVNPASTLSINVDSQNFSAFGANHFVLHVDTTAATEISLNFVRGATILTTKVIEIDADQIAVLTFAAITKANDAVSLLTIGHHVVGKSEATDGNGAIGGLLLVPTGANESLDGDYQRFAHDGVSAIEVAQGVFFSVWHAELESTARQAEYQVKVKMPVIDTASQEATVSFAAASITESGFFALSGVNTVGLGFLKYQSSVGCRLRVLQGTTVLSSVEITPTPIAGDEITLTLNADSVDYVHGANTGSLPVPNGFFSATPNVLAVSGNINPALIVPLSIKVAGA